MGATDALRLDACSRTVSGVVDRVGPLLNARGDGVVGLDGVAIDSVDRLHQTLDASRIRRDCALKLLRGTLSPRPLSLRRRPTERLASVQ